MLDSASLGRLQRIIGDAGVDGWLLFDFHGMNPIAVAMIGLEGMTTRRCFAWVPATGTPIGLSHAIEQGPWRKWPREWENRRYSGWRALERELASLVRGKRAAMEWSAGDAIPYLDRVPAGVVEMVRAAGAEIVSSAELVTRFYAVLDSTQRASHERAAAAISRIAHDAMSIAADRAAREPITEHELAAWIRDEFARGSLETDHGPIVAVNANAADPHYEPQAGASAPISKGAVLLVDLWAREPGGVYADQTWMASLGDPSAQARAVWNAVRDARDAAIALLDERIGKGALVRGAEVDDVARGVIERHGFGDFFTHRTGHSIDAHDPHGSGPNLDNLESREDRVLVPGLAFSIEPGVYLPGAVGMRTEVNGLITDAGLLITPSDYQRELAIF